MKRLVLFISSILVPCIALAWSGIAFFSSSTPAPSGAVCGNWAIGGTMHEDWDGANDLVWDSFTGSGGTVSTSENATPAGVCGFDGDWARLTIGSGNGGDAFLYHDYGSAIGDYYIRFTLYIDSESLANNEQVIAHNADQFISSDDGNQINLQKDGTGNLQLELYSGWGARDTVNITTGQAYCVEANFDLTGGSWEWRVTAESGGTYPDPVSEGSGSDSPQSAKQYFIFGQYNTTTPNILRDIMTDHFDVSTTGWLGCDDA